MGYKVKTTKIYENGIGQELPDAYAWKVGFWNKDDWQTDEK